MCVSQCVYYNLYILANNAKHVSSGNATLYNVMLNNITQNFIHYKIYIISYEAIIVCGYIPHAHVNTHAEHAFSRGHVVYILVL